MKNVMKINFLLTIKESKYVPTVILAVKLALLLLKKIVKVAIQVHS